MTAIVVSYHTGWRLRDCLNALKSDPEVDEIILVDNGNPPDDTAWIDAFVARTEHLHLLRPGRNLGFGAANNLGAASAHGDLLVFINPDAMIRRGSVSAFKDALASRTSPALVGGKIFGLDGREQRGARRRDLTWTTAIGLQRWTLQDTPPPAGPVPMPVISGAFFAMSKVDFEIVDGFDERYFLHVEDVDLCRRVRAAGGSVIYQPRAAALHFSATSDARGTIVARHKADSLGTYFKTWAHGPVDRLINAILLPLLTFWVRRG
ncbi:MAG: glycosyltransferase family 2 protein [Pseudomonadota bacterium]